MTETLTTPAGTSPPTRRDRAATRRTATRQAATRQAGDATARPGPPGSRARTLWRGRPEDPAWVHPGLLALLLATALLYLWDLGSSSGNSFYAAAVQAGTQSWKAMFLGSLDAGNAITVDKPALSL
jgi:hypothetical protein